MERQLHTRLSLTTASPDVRKRGRRQDSNPGQALHGSDIEAHAIYTAVDLTVNHCVSESFLQFF